MSSKETTSLLFTPLKIRGVTLNNRVGVAPMCIFSANDGMINDFHLAHYGSFALGRAGLVMVEATGVEARGRISRNCPGLWKDEQIAPMANLVKFLKSQGSVPAIQLAHSGRKGGVYAPWEREELINTIPIKDGGWQTIGASALAFNEKIKAPVEASLNDIEVIKRAWLSAAERAVKAGFEVIELHYAHGYLLSTFLSLLSNKRTDKYGGSFENRIRLGLEIAKSIRKILPENLVLMVRVSVTDYGENGWDVKQTTEFAKRLKEIGVDFLDCSSGGIINVPYDGLTTNTVQIKAAKTIQNQVGIPTVAVGKIVEPNFAENILKDNGATLIFIGRAFLNTPHWLYNAADVLKADKQFVYPNPYEWAIGWKAWVKWRKDNLKDTNNN